MNILIIGSGGREHALCYAFAKSEKTGKIFCADGNAGIAQIAECVNIKPEDVFGLADFAENNEIDITFVGGETALSLGIADEFEKRGLRIIGASRKAAQLESSKSFAKDFMARHSIPTAKYKTAFSIGEAQEILSGDFFGDENEPVVVKADGLASGKGVVVAADKKEAVAAVSELEQLAGKNASEKIVLEECLFGSEVSLLMFCDGKNFALMPPVRDHKRIGEGDTGANTGGMGTVSDYRLLSENQIEEVIAKIIEPTLEGCAAEGFPFKGILFLGLMLTADGIKVLEYNVRFGDPETQVIMIRLESDLVDVCEAMHSETLNQAEIKWKNGSAVCVVLASKGYPAKAQTGDIIIGLENIDDEIVVFHAGTKKNDSGQYITAGGRVLGVTAIGEDLETALEKSYAAVDKINWNGVQFRRDIGK